MPLYSLRRLPGTAARPSESGTVVLPSPQPSPTGEGVDVQAAFELF